MKKTEVNNEIVSLRQFVRQARICVINKLVREAKRLRTNHVGEKHLERNQNRADKLLKEVFALKRIKDDEVSKFGIVRSDDLQDLLRNPDTDDGTRAMIKVVRYKALNVRIMEFKEKFPDYDKYISWKQKKHSPKRKKNNLDTVPPMETAKRLRSDTKDKVGTKCTKDTDDVACSNDEHGPTGQRTVKSNEKCVESTPDTSTHELQGKNLDKNSEEDRKNVQKGPNTRAISKEAAVKRFAEVIQETNVQETKDKHEADNDRQACKEPVEHEKRPDDFFLHSDDAVSCSHAETFSRDEYRNNDTSFPDNSFKELRRTNGKGKFHRDTISKERGSNVKGKAERQDRFREQNSMDDQSWKRNKKDTGVARKSTQENVQAANAVENEHLHPSWAAKKKQQEVLKQGFQGKKIRFDDD